MVSASSYGDSVNYFLEMNGTNIRVNSQGKVTYENHNLELSPKTNEKIYTIDNKNLSLYPYQRERVVFRYKDDEQKQVKRVTLIRDGYVPNDGKEYSQTSSTIDVIDSRAVSLTKCNFQSRGGNILNKDRMVPRTSIDNIWDSVESLLDSSVSKLNGHCISVTNRVCEDIKRQLKAPDFEKAKKDLKTCVELTSGIQKAFNFPTESFVENIDDIRRNWQDMNTNKTRKVSEKQQWEKFYSNLFKGTYSNIYENIKGLGTIIVMCEGLEFYDKESKSKLVTPSEVGIIRQ